ncbi:hypothetical protein BKA70DRAFT_1185674 [Coprinopsis sp. MPI-PUGE-AT-0042]|nr:hypothetical protein BKA70DRAFT_1185674 [Coprinopsis sp. MPI-PUGE-AT-0042]
MDFYIASKKSWEGGIQVAAYGGVAVAGRHTLERSLRLDPETEQTTEIAQMVAVSDALRLATGSSRLRVHTSSRSLIDSLTKKLGYLEDRAWTTHRQGKEMEGLVSRIRRRDGYTVFILAKAERLPEPMKRAMELAEAATNNQRRNSDRLEPYTPSQIQGARLETLSQSDMYKLVLNKRRHGIKPRRCTQQNMGETREAVRRRTGTRPDQEKVWESYKTKAVQSRKAKALLWKMMHGALPIGEMWNRRGGNEEKATCPLCRTIESAEHLFSKCKGNGQETIWGEARNLLEKAGLSLPREIDVPTILGSALTDFRTEGNPDIGRNNLYTKIIIESTYLIWVLRCKWKIGDKGNAQKIISPPEARNRWRAMVNATLAVEVIGTDKKRYGNKALDKNLVLATWQRVVGDEEMLSKAIDGSWSNGVVVGIG